MNAQDKADLALYDQRIVRVFGVIDDAAAYEIIGQLETLGSDTYSPIKLILNSPGGSVPAGLALFDTVRQLDARGVFVGIEARGEAASMGAVLLQAASDGGREMSANARLLLHELMSSASPYEKATETEERVRELQQLRKRLTDLMIGRSKISPTQLRQKISRQKRDWWLSAPEALENGLIDRIA